MTFTALPSPSTPGSNFYSGPAALRIQGYRATFTAVLDAAALGHAQPHQHYCLRFSRSGGPVPWSVDLTFAAALGSSDDLVPLFTLLHDLQHRWTTQQLTAA
eukprot:850024-Pleurochrysis_carterae.AAC.1